MDCPGKTEEPNLQLMVLELQAWGLHNVFCGRKNELRELQVSGYGRSCSLTLRSLKFRACTKTLEELEVSGSFGLVEGRLGSLMLRRSGTRFRITPPPPLPPPPPLSPPPLPRSKRTRPARKRRCHLKHVGTPNEKKQAKQYIYIYM